ncbi:hypothetical protein NDU88_007692 [Pleurodeles waltl]|uniref:Uncharacterized protein n=1 Tax=Pleurodeles waltl TaxID=8319 RepID=A0AAV7PM22_PLEWA|nr:hypothetical protein NDU88_007692 [Pleurodeles waltl]
MRLRGVGGRGFRAPLSPLSRRGFPRSTRCFWWGLQSPGPSPIRDRARGCSPSRSAAPPLTGSSSAQPKGSPASGSPAYQQQSSGPHSPRSDSSAPRHRSAARSDSRGCHFVSGGRDVKDHFAQLFELDSSPRGPLCNPGVLRCCCLRSAPIFEWRSAVLSGPGPVCRPGALP